MRDLISGFETVRTVSVTLDDLAPVAQDIAEHFQQQEYEVFSLPQGDGNWRVDITKGGLFATIVGIKTALNILLERIGDETRISAGVGVFELQAVPTIMTVLVFPPIIIGQIIGLVQQEKLDNEAVEVAEASLRRHAMMETPPPAPPVDFAATEL